jgi:hypothetical protein
MEDLSRNMEKVVKAHTPPKPSKSAGSWSVLLLEDHGRMVLLGKLKRLVIPLALVLIIATVSFAWLLIVFKSTREEKGQFLECFAFRRSWPDGISWKTQKTGDSIGARADYCYSFFCLAINCFQKHKRR